MREVEKLDDTWFLYRVLGGFGFVARLYYYAQTLAEAK